jgi:hypothetical protein
MEFKYALEKNMLLFSQRGITFDDIIEAIANDKLIDIRPHPNPEKYPNQKILFVKMDNEVYVIPFVEEENGDLFLKTAYPSRKARKLLLD